MTLHVRAKVYYTGGHTNFMTRCYPLNMISTFMGWLVGCIGLYGPLRLYIWTYSFIAFSARYSLFVLMCRKTHITHSLSLHRAVSQREGERKEK